VPRLVLAVLISFAVLATPAMAARTATPDELQGIIAATPPIDGDASCIFVRISTVDPTWARVSLTNADGCPQADGRGAYHLVNGTWTPTEGGSNVVLVCPEGGLYGAPKDVSIDLQFCRAPVTVVHCYEYHDADMQVPKKHPKACTLGNEFPVTWVQLRDLRWQSWGKSTATARGRARFSRILGYKAHARISVTASRPKTTAGGDTLYTRVRIKVAGMKALVYTYRTGSDKVTVGHG